MAAVEQNDGQGKGTQEAHPHTLRFVEILRELRDLHTKKAKDYGDNTTPLRNIVFSAELLGLDPITGALLRMSDKLFRLGSFVKKGELANESMEDSLRDIAVYAIICLVLLGDQEEVVTE